MLGKAIKSIQKYVRAANYLSAAQIYLHDNFLLEKKLSFDDIKPRLLGHWGTCPGINFIYANLNHQIKKYSAETLFVMGPGHGFAALQSNLFLEGSLGKYYSEATQTENGIGYIIKNFSWPYAFPSHSNPGAPGVILEGGELGYALSTAYGAVLDNPDLIAACVVGDGEAETGPTATAWHLNKFIDPKTCGAVLPILHLNEYKISGPTIFGRMTNEELEALFYGYGYDPYILEGRNIYKKAIKIFDKCFKLIYKIRKKARSKKGLDEFPRLPMIILKTSKGWTGIKELRGDKIESNYLSHQVVVKNAKTDKVELEALEKWLKSYKFEELFDKSKGFAEEIKNIIPEDNLKMGLNKNAFGKKTYKSLILPSVEKFAEEIGLVGSSCSSSMRRSGLYLNEVFKLNKSNFRLFSPDETYSNKLDEVFKSTSRAFVLPIKKNDDDMARSGGVIEMLSEHSLQGLMQGYVLTGRHAIFDSYEAFIQIIASMVDQYAKFLRVAQDFEWRGDIPSLNYILTSSGWRQEHNGFSHQNPGFLGNMLQKPGCAINVYFPPDGNSTLVVLKKCLESKNSINIIIAGKTCEPRWLTPELAEQEMKNGIMVWDFASDKNPDIVVSGIGDYMTKEALAAIDIVKKEAPEIKIRFVNICALSPKGLGIFDGGLSEKEFKKYFTSNKPVIFNFHGYPQILKQILFDYKGEDERYSIHGYIENGSTTTPFDMQIRNNTSRWQLAMEIFEKTKKKIKKGRAVELIKKYQNKILDHAEYIKKYGVDPEEIELWQWKKS